jgi:hypothetical protein
MPALAPPLIVSMSRSPAVTAMLSGAVMPENTWFCTVVEPSGPKLTNAPGTGEKVKLPAAALKIWATTETSVVAREPVDVLKVNEAAIDVIVELAGTTNDRSISEVAS